MSVLILTLKISAMLSGPLLTLKPAEMTFETILESGEIFVAIVAHLVSCFIIAVALIATISNCLAGKVLAWVFC